MNHLQVIEQNNQRVLTTAQLAESYGTNSDRISKNFSENKARYKSTKHFILLQGNELKAFKDDFRNSELVRKQASSLYLWTEKGAWLHAKSLNTDQAWDAYEMLVDDYYNMKSNQIDTTQLSPELQMFNQMYKALAKSEIETKEAKELALIANEKADNISNIVTMNSDEWREKVKVILRKIAQKWSGIEPYRSVINLSYDRFEKRAGCKLDIRLNNRKERALAQGMTKAYIKKINKLDCISEEKRLIEIYIQVVKEMAIQHKININDFKFQEVI